MAQREEQEMDVCTFQPNTPRRHSSISSRSGAVASLSLLSYAVGGGCGNEEGSTENSSKRPPASEGGGKGKDSDVSRSVGAVGLRLFEESKRLRERRFEGEERKRMGDEEAYARTCTFKVTTVAMVGTGLFLPRLHVVRLGDTVTVSMLVKCLAMGSCPAVLNSHDRK